MGAIPMSFLHLVAAHTAPDEQALIVAIVLARLLVPLLIPRFPLVIIAALVLDAVDDSLLARSPRRPRARRAVPELRQGARHLLPGDRLPVDDAQLDEPRRVPHRAVPLLLPARRRARVRALGERAMLLIFPNTFEYFFIAYEVIGCARSPSRWSRALLAARPPRASGSSSSCRRSTGSTSPSSTSPRPSPTTRGSACSARSACSRSSPCSGSSCARGCPRPTAAGASPPTRSPRRRRAPRPSRWGELAEKAALLGLMSVIFAEILPTVQMSALEVALGVAAIVVVNTAITLAGRSLHVPLRRRLVANLGLIYLGAGSSRDAEDFPLGTGLFFAFLITLLIWLYDLYKPVYESRTAAYGGDRDQRMMVTCSPYPIRAMQPYPARRDDRADRFTAAGFARSPPVPGRRARLSRRAPAAQQGPPLPGRPAAHRGDHRGHALLRRRAARRPRARADRRALARRAAHPGSARSDRARPRPPARLGARPTRQGRPPPRGRHGRLGLRTTRAVAAGARDDAGRAAVLRDQRPLVCVLGESLSESRAGRVLTDRSSRPAATRARRSPTACAGTRWRRARIRR